MSLVNSYLPKAPKETKKRVVKRGEVIQAIQKYHFAKLQENCLTRLGKSLAY